MQRLPSLNLLPAFDAAARHQSFSKAAHELHVTTAAISQQIKQLESQLDMKLFQRLTRRVELTEAGQAFAQVVSHTLTTFRLGHADFRHRFTQPVLRMSMTPLVAHSWLLPNLAAFQSAHPGVDVRLDSTMELVDFAATPVDVALRVGSGEWPGLESWHLCDSEIVLVASARLMAQSPIRHWTDLKNHTLIHPRQSHLDWHAVAALANWPSLERKGDLVLDSDLAAWRAAEQGLGIAVCLLPKGASGEPMRRDGLVSVFPPFEFTAKVHFVFRADSGKEAVLRSAFAWMKAHLVRLSDANAEPPSVTSAP